MSCVPGPGANAGKDQGDNFVGPAIEARWISIAGDPPKGIIGESAVSRSQADAENSALGDCTRQGGTDCKTITSVKNGCAAMATSTTTFGAAFGHTEDEAKQGAINLCKKGVDQNCRPIYLKCVKPAIL
jgi:hypothetical protein